MGGNRPNTRRRGWERTRKVSGSLSRENDMKWQNAQAPVYKCLL